MRCPWPSCRWWFAGKVHPWHCILCPHPLSTEFGVGKQFSHKSVNTHTDTLDTHTHTHWHTHRFPIRENCNTPTLFQTHTHTHFSWRLCQCFIRFDASNKSWRFRGGTEALRNKLSTRRLFHHWRPSRIDAVTASLQASEPRDLAADLSTTCRNWIARHVLVRLFFLAAGKKNNAQGHLWDFFRNSKFRSATNPTALIGSFPSGDELAHDGIFFPTNNGQRWNRGSKTGRHDMDRGWHLAAIFQYNVKMNVQQCPLRFTAPITVAINYNFQIFCFPKPKYNPPDNKW